MQEVEKKFNAMSVQDKCELITGAASELVYKFYYEQDRDGLKLLSKEFASISEIAENCVDCLEFLNNQGGVFAKIYLLLEFLGRDGMSENFVSQLEELASRARSALEESDITAADNMKGLLNIRAVMREHELEWEAAQQED